MHQQQHVPETRSLQVWPGGQSFTIQGDPDGPATQRRLRTREDKRWRKGTAQEWRAIRIELRAELYGERDIQGCDSSLVDDLIKAAASGELRGDLAEGFSYDEIRNLYPDPSDWNAEQCREYASDNGIDLPDTPVTDCEACDGSGHITRDDPASIKCAHCDGTGEVPEDGYEEDDSRHGWLTEARDACREYAQDNPAEVYEWWRVTKWLCNQLHAIGEVTIDNGYGCWWGRTCTGQMWIMDGTLQKVAAQSEEA